MPDPLPKVDCGGNPEGTWRLTDLAFAPATFDLFEGVTAIGQCALALHAEPQLPSVTMMLGHTGEAQYFAGPGKLQAAWAENCTSSQTVGYESDYSCGSKLLPAFEDCQLDCGVCSCTGSSQETDIDAGSWTPTASGTSMYLAPFGRAANFSFCANETTLELVGDGSYMKFERGYLKPGCDLHDVGVKEGCDLIAPPPNCAGTPTACADLDANQCSKTPGCAIAPVCSGPQLDCSTADQCMAPCMWGPASCLGTVACSDFTSLEACHGQANVIFPNNPCTWHDDVCVGTVAIKCADLTIEACEATPGCQLAIP